MSAFNDLTEEQQMALQAEFENPDTDDDRRIELLEMLREGANETPNLMMCTRCKNNVFFAPHAEPLIEGHIYSHGGLAEMRISGLCEYCFDNITEEPLEDHADVFDFNPEAL